MSDDKQIELLLVDGSALLHRAYHAFPKTFSHNGKMVNAVYGVASIFITAMEEIKPEYVNVAWDVPKPTFRHEKYIGYKAHRPKTDQELIDQIPMVYEMLDQFGVVQVKEEGYEADDIIGSAADKYKSQVDQVVVLTGDQDMMQLVEEKIGLLVPGRGQIPPKLYGVAEVEEKYGVSPDQIVDYKALVGDSSDNIPGVVGVGPKTAVQLLQKYETLEGIYHKMEQVGVDFKPRIAKLLEDGKDGAYLSQELSQIKRDMKLGENLEEMEYEGLKNERVKRYLEKMNFRSLKRRVFGEEKKSVRQAQDKQDERQIGLF